MPALNHTELNQRYHSFLASSMDAGATEEARQLFGQFWKKSKEELATPELQRALWKRSKVFFLGYGENVDCEPLVQDARVVELLADLPHRAWSPDAQGRAQQVQDAYDSLLALAAPLCEKTPRSKLHRAMLLLLPDQLHFGLNGEYSKHIYRQVVGGSKVGVQRLQGAVLARLRLRAVLGPEDEGVLDDHIRRGQFLSYLASQAIQDGCGSPDATA